MLSSGESAATEERAGGRMRISVAEPVRLRDYFLRLGAHAEIVEGASGPLVHVESADFEIEEFLDSWVAINQTQASIVQQQVVTLTSRLGAAAPSRPRLGDLLLAKGMITDSQLEEALAESFAAGDLLGRVLLRHQWIFEDELARTLAEQLGLPYVNLRYAGLDNALARLVPFEIGMRFAAVPVCFHGDSVRVAFADPSDEPAQQAIKTHFPTFHCAVAELSDIEMALRTVHRTNVQV
ncbi:MAG: GspE/PulE/PilB domain-containing protein [Solirubrobacteraceae bacterium]